MADGPSPSSSNPAPKLPPDLAKRIQEITDVVLEHHIDPPVRQQMILAGTKALYQVAGVPAPHGLVGRVSAVATPEQLAGFLADTWPKTTAKPVTAQELQEGLLNGLLQAVPGVARLVPAKERKVEEQIEGNRYVGVHIALSMDEQEKRPVIQEVFKGGPADRAGVRKGDWLEAVDGVDTKGMRLTDVIDRSRGDEGTDVVFTVRQPRETKARTMKITRGQLPHSTIQGIRNRSSGGWDVRLDGPDPIGYLRITEIGASTPHELHKLAEQLESEGARALVLDLRGVALSNSVHAAVLLADCLLDSRPIGCVQTLQGETTYQADSDALFRSWPMAVLVGAPTSGTAEWLAAALQDNHRAVIVGTPTAGAIGTPGNSIVHSTIPVGDGAWSITLATGRLERGDGRPLSRPLEAALGNHRDGLVFARRRAAKIETGVTPDHLVGSKTEGPAGLGQLMRHGQDQEHATTTEKSLERAVQLLRESLKKS
jgi:carboxyl-terminal processing protease